MDGFFGRASELASLRDAAASVFRDGRVTVVHAEGDPGAGKSALLAEFLPQLPATSTVSVTCYEPEARLPLSLARTLVEALRVSSGRDLGGSEAHAGDPSGGWAGLAEALHREVAARAPIAIVVDDVQWCDEGSVGVLHHLLRGAVTQDDPLLLILVARPSSTVAALADAVQRLGIHRFVHVDLGPLEGTAAVTLIRSLDRALDHHEAAKLAVRAGGSPFWCRFLATATDRHRPTDEIITGRLRSMSADATAVLTTCVVLSRPVAIAELAEIHGWTDGRVRRALHEGTASGLVIEQGTEIRLAHDLVRDAVEGRLTGTRASHELIASWLEDHAGEDVSQLLAAAQHRSTVGLPTGPTLQRVLASPMRRMIGFGGLQTVVELVDEVPLDDPSAVRLSEGVAALAADLGRHSLALERWTRVAGRLAGASDRARARIAACEAAQHLELVEDARGHLRAARRIAPVDRLLAVELDTAEARLLRWLEHDLDSARRLTDRAVHNARTLVDSTPGPAAREAYLRVLVLACVDAMQRNAADEILPLADEITDAAAGADTRASVEARLRSGSALMLVGRLDAADRELSSAWSDATRAFLTDLRLDVGTWLTWTRYLRGELAQAEEVAAECVSLADRLAERTRLVSMVAQWRRIIEISCGNHLDALEALRDLAAEEPDAHHRIALRQTLATWLARLHPEGSADEVRDELDAATSDSETANCLRCRAELLLSGAEALARIGACEQAELWLREGRGCADGGALQRWLAARAEASLAVATEPDPDVSPAALERAIALADDLGMRLEAIWARLDLGAALVARQPHHAARILQAASSSAQASGARTEARVAAHLLRRTGERTWHRSRRPEPAEPFEVLSPREREIAALISGGASNPEIARALFLSRKTIERHVSNIFLKTGVKNRTELAARIATARERSTE